MVNRTRQVHLSFLPSSRGGRWSVGLAVISLLALAFVVLVVASGGVIFDNWLLTGATLAVAVAGLAGLVAALLAVLRSHERGLLVLLPILWGFVAAFFPVGAFWQTGR
jgi:hypothetical protein